MKISVRLILLLLLTATFVCADSELVYSLDSDSGKINFSDKSYDVSEPVYPQEFAVMIYSLVDWSKADNSSFLFLRSGRKSCGISNARVKRISTDEFNVNIDMYYNETVLEIRNGMPVKYVIDKDETFELLNQ